MPNYPETQCGEREWKVLKSYLEEGGSIHEEYEDGYGDKITPLGKACLYGWLKLTKIFIEKGVDIDRPISTGGSRPIHVAYLCEHWDLVDYLKEKGANLKGVDKFDMDIEDLLKTGEKRRLCFSRYDLLAEN